MRSERLLAGLAMLWVAISLSCSSTNGNGPVGPSQTALRIPTDLLMERVAPDTLRISWKYQTASAHGIRIERSVGNAGAFALRDTVLTDVSFYADTLVQPGTTYYYRVRAYLKANISDPSETVWGTAATDVPPTVPASPDPPDPPPDPNFEVDPGPVTLQWTATDPDAGDQISYDVLYGRSRNEMTYIARAITATSIAVPEQVVMNSHYFWRITVRDSKGAMKIGPLWGFNTTVERVTIPADSSSTYFIMGSRNRTLPSGDPNPFWFPSNPVRVGKFQIDKYPITNQQYADFLNLALHRNPPQVFTTGGGVYDPAGVTLYAKTNELSDYSQISYDRDLDVFIVSAGKERFPAIEVSWEGATVYAEFFGRRLPTEAEWEFAARGNQGEAGDSTFTLPDNSHVTVGFGRDYPWGDAFDRRRCNYLGSGDPYEGQGRVTTTPIGFFDGQSHGGFATLDGSSPFGVQDMAGNAWNWCSDWYTGYDNPHFPPTDGLYRIIRGGSWQKGPDAVRSFVRSFASPEQADWAICFRTAKTLP